MQMRSFTVAKDQNFRGDIWRLVSNHPSPKLIQLVGCHSYCDYVEQVSPINLNIIIRKVQRSFEPEHPGFETGQEINRMKEGPSKASVTLYNKEQGTRRWLS